MINRNKNSAVARARAEMQQAVNSSRRSVRSANRLNSSRYTKDKMIRAMEAAGYYYDDIDSDDANYVVFNGEYGTRMTFDNLNEVADWLDGVVFDDPEIADTVDAILNSNRRVNSSRHMSYKTRKAVEYSINCARRRAGLNCGVARYAGNEEYQTYYFITADNSFVASFDVEIHENEIEFAGFMRGYSAGGYVVNENSVFGDFAPGTDIAQALADFVYNKTGVTVYETENVKEFNNQLLTINKIFTNSRKSRIEKYTELRRAGYSDR